MAIIRFYSTDAFHSSRLTQVLNALQEVSINTLDYFQPLIPSSGFY